MRIRRIELSNFRQFYGVQSIDLAAAQGQNVAVIYGENGRGKTGIYRALMFCLYGHKHLDQDRNYDKEDSVQLQNLYLVNTAALDDDAKQGGKGVEAYVKVEFDHEGQVYEMFRSLFAAQKADGTTVENDNGLKLTIRDVSGNTSILNAVDGEKIKTQINAILNERVKDYFLFDGERIERLTKVTSQQRKEIQAGIKNLLKIDELYTAEKALKGLEDKISKELQKVSTGEYLKKLAEKDQLDAKIQGTEQAIETYESEMESAQLQIAEIDKQLESVKDHRHLLDKQKDLEERKKALGAGRSQKVADMRKFMTSASVLLAGDLVDQVYVDIEAKRAKGEVPSEIKKELIERLLQEMKCICGRPVEVNTEPFFTLQLWNTKAGSQAFEQYVMQLYGKLTAAKATIDGKAAELITVLTSFASMEEDLDQVNLALDSVQQQLEGVPKTDVAEKQKARNTYVKKIVALEVQMGDQKSQIVNLQKQLVECKQKIEVLAKESNLHSELQQKLSLVDKSRQAMKRIIADFVEEVRKQLEVEANKNFQRLLDDDGRKTLKQIVVRDDYTLEVLDFLGRPFLVNVSAGQRQVISLCFITALAQVAGGSHVLEVPLFMDTPFGRLSSEHRYNLLKEIPEITPQWVLLATETEFTTKEYELLKGSGKWGRLYVLEAEREGVTKIKEVPVGAFQPKR